MAFVRVEPPKVKQGGEGLRGEAGLIGGYYNKPETAVFSVISMAVCF